MVSCCLRPLVFAVSRIVVLRLGQLDNMFISKPVSISFRSWVVAVGFTRRTSRSNAQQKTADAGEKALAAALNSA